MSSFAPENQAILSGKPSRTEISMRVKGILADRTGFIVSGMKDTTHLLDLGTVRSVQYALDVIERSFQVTITERRSFDWFAKVSVGELISLVEGAIQ